MVLKNFSLLSFIASPFFLAIPISIIIIILLPVHSSKYKLEFIDSQITGKPNSLVYFYDLNNDGVDEMLDVFHNSLRGDAAIKVSFYNDMGYDQWNFSGKYQIHSENKFVYDFNKDSFPEIVSVYYRYDSVFMSVTQPFPGKEMLLNDFFITTVDKRDGKIDYSIRCPNAVDNDNDGFREFVFIFFAGFSRQPRQLMMFDFQDNTLSKTSSAGFNFSHLEIADLNNDSLPEYYLGTGTTGNIPDSLNIPFSDYNSYLVAYNHDLELITPPLKNDSKPSGTKVSEIKDFSGKTLLVSYFAKNGIKHDSLIIYENLEKQIASFLIPSNPNTSRNIYMIQYNYYGDDGLLICSVDNKLLFLNSNLEIIKISNPTKNSDYLKEIIDLNSDGNDEFVFSSGDGSNLIIYDYNFKNQVRVNTEYELHSDKPFISGRRITAAGPELYILCENKLFFYNYLADSFYYLKYLLWISIYSLVVFILWLSQKLQKIQTYKKQQVEERINSLQFKTIKSQMDPHFMFNVLNGIAYTVAKGKTEEAHDQIIRFSKLLRTLLTRVNRIDVSILEELEFVQNYLELEKFRFKDEFSFSIDPDENADLEQRLPRMLVQLLVENSIKHGLRNKPGKKEIKITIKTEDSTIIIVEDNGIGRKEAAKYMRDSGQGTKLLDQMIMLNKKSGGNDISFNYFDLVDDQGNASGTRVEVVLG